MTLLNETYRNRLRQVVEPFAFTVTDRVNEILMDRSAGILSDLSYTTATGDTRQPWREFHDTWRRTFSHDYTGPASLDMPQIEEFSTEGRYAPHQKVFPGGSWEIERDGQRPIESLVDELSETQRAIEREVAQVRIDKLFELIITDNSGLGGITPIGYRTLYNASNTQLRAPEKPAWSNILYTEIGSLTAPTIRDAHILARAAEDHFAAVDATGRNAFVNPEAARQGLYFVTSSNAWYQAFRDLQGLDTLATSTSAAADNASNYRNVYQGVIRVEHASNQTGKPWEPWVRCFYVGPREDDRPIIMAPDLGARPYTLDDKDPFYMSLGFLVSWYTVAWKPDTAILFQPTEA